MTCFKTIASLPFSIFQFSLVTKSKLLIHALNLIQNTVQIVLNWDTKLLKSKYDLKFAITVNANLTRGS